MLDFRIKTVTICEYEQDESKTQETTDEGAVCPDCGSSETIAIQTAKELRELEAEEAVDSGGQGADCLGGEYSCLKCGSVFYRMQI